MNAKSLQYQRSCSKGKLSHLCLEIPTQESFVWVVELISIIDHLGDRPSLKLHNEFVSISAKLCFFIKFGLPQRLVWGQPSLLVEWQLWYSCKDVCFWFWGWNIFFEINLHFDRFLWFYFGLIVYCNLRWDIPRGCLRSCSSASSPTIYGKEKLCCDWPFSVTSMAFERLRKVNSKKNRTWPLEFLRFLKLERSPCKYCYNYIIINSLAFLYIMYFLI